MPSMFADEMKVKKQHKEGWIAGAFHEVKRNGDLEVAFAFPVEREELVESDILRGEKDGYKYYGFLENTLHPEDYDNSLEASLGLICEEFRPDVIHCYGTEFPHTLAILRTGDWSKRVLIHVQGVMSACAREYYAGLPKKVRDSVTFRDLIRKDSITEQKEKYDRRAERAETAMKAASFACGRTAFDKNAVNTVNPSCVYYNLNETLRSCFYEGRWDINECEPHRIFISQGNIPLKGLHILLNAMPYILEKYPDAKIAVAGDDVVRGNSLKDRIKLPEYGKYLKELITKYDLQDKVEFLGALDAKSMKKQYLKANVFVMPSSMENSPNSLGEAMILGMPCVASEVGGIPSLAENGKEVLLVPSCEPEELAKAIVDIFKDPLYASVLGENAAKRASLTHDMEANYKMLKWIYEEVAKNSR